MTDRPFRGWAWRMCGLGALLIALCGAARAQNVGATEPPAAVERFFGPPAMDQAALSPSGRWLGALVAVPGRRVGFHVIDLDGKEAPRTIEASATDDVAWFEWADDDWLLFGLRDTVQPRYVYRGGGLLRMRRDGTEARQLIARGWNDRPRGARPPDTLYLGLAAPGSLEVRTGTPHYDQRGDYSYLTLGVLHIVTREWRRTHDDAPRASGWFFDPQGRPRLIQQQDERELRYLWAEADGDRVGPWREIGRMPLLETTWEPAYIDSDGQLFVTTRDAQGYMELRAFDLASARPAAPPRLSTPGFSGEVGPLQSRRGGPVVGVSLELDAPTAEWFTPELKALQARIDARWPGRVNVLSCQPCEKPQRVLVHSYADNDPGQFLLFHPASDRWQLLGSARPDIEPARMARAGFERIRARDGRDLPLWVTRLPGPVDMPRPAVVLVHGGPNVRGVSWGWHADAQFLASRGYVVIEPEFRGSTGYGFEHYRAGWKQWGRGMIDDLTDAARHLVATGLVDPQRLCVMGGSYGGYAALMSLVKEPEMYRCGVAHAAVTDPRHRFEFHWSDLTHLSKQAILPLTMGDPQADAQMLIETSPLEQVRRIRAPVLLTHGDDDVRVPIENGERMRDALKKAGKSVEWFEYVDEGHGFSRPANERDYWRRVEAFLARHLK